MSKTLPEWWTDNFDDAIVTALGIAQYHGMKCRVTKEKFGDWRVKVIGARSQNPGTT